MKKIIIGICLFLVTKLCVAQVIPNELYIYRDGQVITSFFIEDIDSIVYSDVDLDSIKQETIVTQDVYLLDTIYRFSIQEIDSISFVTPLTVYQPGVIKLEGEIRSYITDVDSLTLTFKGETPAAILPKIGDKLVTLEIDDIITEPFLGQVKGVNLQEGKYLVDCEVVSLTDVFDTYFSTSYYSLPLSSSSKRQLKTDNFFETNNTISPGEQMISYLHMPNVSYEKNNNLSFSIPEHESYISVTPKINYAASLCVQKENGITITVRTITDYHWHEYFSLSGSLTATKDGKLWTSPPIRIPEALVDIDFVLGWYLSASGEISTSQNWKQHYRHTFLFSWNSKGKTVLKNTNKLQQISHSHEGLLAINGNVKAGLDGKVRVSFICTKDLDIANIDIAIKAGISLDGTFVPYKKDAAYAKKTTDLYNQIKNDKIRIGTEVVCAPLEFKMFKWSVSPFPDIPIISPNKLPHYEWNTVPRFSDTKLEKGEDGKYFATAKISGNVLKTDAGFALINQTNTEDTTILYCKKDYTNQAGDMAEGFFDKSEKDSYIVYPIVKYMNMELLADPSAGLSICDDDNHQHMVDLGLPSGTLWSCMNLGATKPEEVGDYFAFGETSTKERFTDNNYLYYEPNGGNPYYSSIGANISGTIYDAATVNWGDGWRMPTLQEQQELLDNCTFELTTRNGVSGYLATGPNGNSIFLPFAPVKNNANYGAVTYYRSSFISSASLGNIFMAGTESISFMDSKAPNLSHVCYRYLGAVIRPVKTKP